MLSQAYVDTKTQKPVDSCLGKEDIATNDSVIVELQETTLP